MSTHILQRFPVIGDRGTPAAGLWKRLWSLLPRGAARVGADRFSMELGSGQGLRLHDAAGWTVACLRGSIWLTQEADTRDVFLDAGDRFTLDRAGLALMLARQNAAVELRPPDSGDARTFLPRAEAAPAADSAREVWLRAVYPECGPWNDPAAYRRAGLL